MASDLFTAPAVKGRAVDISVADAPVYCRALYVGGLGNVVGILAEDTAPVTFVGVPAGTVLPVSFMTVGRTGTTATLLVALY